MLKKCVLTIVIGEKYNKIFEHTKYNMEMYSKKINADFVVINNISHKRINFIRSIIKNKYNISRQRCVRYCKLFILHDILKKYDRVIYFDCSCLIHNNTPNLFNLVPIDTFGAVQDHNKLCKQYGIGINNHNPFYNTGVLVISKYHKNIFSCNFNNMTLPHSGYCDQTLINYFLFKYKTKIQALKKKYNIVGSILKKKSPSKNIEKGYLIFHFTRSFYDDSNIIPPKKLIEISLYKKIINNIN